MDADVRELIGRLHDAGRKVVLAATGGGSLVAGWLLAVPGGSRSVLEIVIPYAESSFAHWLGYAPLSSCSATTAEAMARRAWDLALNLAPGEEVVGIGCTAGLRSDRPKKGDHRVHLAVRRSRAAWVESLTLTKEARTRLGEEELVDRMILNALAEAFDVPLRVELPLLGSESVERQTLRTGMLDRFLAGEFETVCVEPDGRMHGSVSGAKILMSGSFNPLHAGHLELARAAGTLLGQPVAFEMPVQNADKAPLPDSEVRRRIPQFSARSSLWLTRAATFSAKAKLFPGAAFVVGADTAARIVQPRFYGNSEARMRVELEQFRAAGCCFLVAARDDRGRYLTRDDIPYPDGLEELFRVLPAARVDVSSTWLRENAQQQEGAHGSL